MAQQFCRSDRVVRLWIAMFNIGGIDALTTKKPAGRGRRVERLRDLLVPVLANPRQAGELHWTGVKLHAAWSPVYGAWGSFRKSFARDALK